MQTRLYYFYNVYMYIYIYMKIQILLAIIATIIFMMIDSVLFNETKTPLTYIKNSALSGFITGCVLYLTDRNMFTRIPSRDVPLIKENKYVSSDSIPPGEIILTGDPTI